MSATDRERIYLDGDIMELLEKAHAKGLVLLVADSKSMEDLNIGELERLVEGPVQ